MFVRGGKDEKGKFWSGVRNTLLFDQISKHIDTPCTIAMGIHGDGSPTNKVDCFFPFQPTACTADLDLPR
eukprot:1001638-Pyramimonas_sp.AAC.2